MSRTSPSLTRPRQLAKSPPRGLTLIELLVVISILAVLMCLLLPGLSTARETSRKAQCADQMRAIHHAVTTYGTDFGLIPAAAYRDSTTTFSGTNPTKATQWFAEPTTWSAWYYVGPRHTGHHTGKRDSVYCPSYDDQPELYYNFFWSAENRSYVSIDYPDGYPNWGTFGAVYGVVVGRDHPFSLFASPEVARNNGLIRQNSWDRWSASMYMTETRRGDTATANRLDGIESTWLPGATDRHMRGRPFRHNGVANKLYADGHVDDAPIEPSYPKARDGVAHDGYMTPNQEELYFGLDEALRGDSRPRWLYPLDANG